MIEIGSGFLDRCFVCQKLVLGLRSPRCPPSVSGCFYTELGFEDSWTDPQAHHRSPFFTVEALYLLYLNLLATSISQPQWKHSALSYADVNANNNSNHHCLLPVRRKSAGCCGCYPRMLWPWQSFSRCIRLPRRPNMDGCCDRQLCGR